MNIDLINATKKYGSKVILDDLNLTIKDHNAIALIGPSGSGKSTLLRQLSMIEELDEGVIKVNNNTLDPTYRSDYHKHIGFVFQQHNLFPHLTLERNISLILEKTFKENKVEAKKTATELLSKFGLEEHINKKPANISGGQAQRASIARALSSDPDIIFLDEPTASLDPLLTYEVLEAVLDLKELDKDMVIVTHEINFVRRIADYYIYMEEGKIISHGLINELDNPTNPMLKRFLKKVL